MNTRRKVLAELGVAVFGWAAWRSGSSVQQPAAPLAGVGGTRFPNVPLLTHEGREVRFYDDLVCGKVVAINMM